jgi:hypothetical protein
MDSPFSTFPRRTGSECLHTVAFIDREFPSDMSLDPALAVDEEPPTRAPPHPEKTEDQDADDKHSAYDSILEEHCGADGYSVITASDIADMEEDADQRRAIMEHDLSVSLEVSHALGPQVSIKKVQQASLKAAAMKPEDYRLFLGRLEEYGDRIRRHHEDREAKRKLDEIQHSIQLNHAMDLAHRRLTEESSSSDMAWILQESNDDMGLTDDTTSDEPDDPTE